MCSYTKPTTLENSRKHKNAQLHIPLAVKRWCHYASCSLWKTLSLWENETENGKYLNGRKYFMWTSTELQRGSILCLNISFIMAKWAKLDHIICIIFPYIWCNVLSQIFMLLITFATLIFLLRQNQKQPLGKYFTCI